MLFYPAHLWETIPELDILFETLKAAKIVFTEPQAAADHLNAIWSDPVSWWNSVDVVYARNEFRRQVLDLDGDWLKEWITFLEGTIA